MPQLEYLLTTYSDIISVITETSWKESWDFRVLSPLYWFPFLDFLLLPMTPPFLQICSRYWFLFLCKSSLSLSLQFLLHMVFLITFLWVIIKYSPGSHHFKRAQLYRFLSFSLFSLFLSSPSCMSNDFSPLLGYMQMPHPEFKIAFHVVSPHCCCLIAKLCSTLCNPMNCSTPKLAQTHVHWVCEAIQPSHPLLPLSSLVLSVSQHQGLFQWVTSSHQMAKVLEPQLQHRSFQWIFTVDFLQDWLVLSLWSPSDSQESSPAPKFKSINSLELNLLYDPSLISIHDYWKNHSFDYMDLCWQSDVSAFEYAV